MPRPGCPFATRQPAGILIPLGGTLVIGQRRGIATERDAMPSDTAQLGWGRGAGERDADTPHRLVGAPDQPFLHHGAAGAAAAAQGRAGVSFLDLGLALTTFNVTTGLTQAPMDYLVDRLGPRPVLIAGLLLGGFAFLSLGLVGTYPWLLAVAVAAGLANCVYHSADYAMLADSISDHRIGRAFSVHTFAGFLGGAIGAADLAHAVRPSAASRRRWCSQGSSGLRRQRCCS